MNNQGKCLQKLKCGREKFVTVSHSLPLWRTDRTWISLMPQRSCLLAGREQPLLFLNNSLLCIKNAFSNNERFHSKLMQMCLIAHERRKKILSSFRYIYNPKRMLSKYICETPRYYISCFDGPDANRWQLPGFFQISFCKKTCYIFYTPLHIQICLLMQNLFKHILQQKGNWRVGLISTAC